MDCQRASWLLWWAARTPVNSMEQIVRVASMLADLAGDMLPTTPPDGKPRREIGALLKICEVTTAITWEDAATQAVSIPTEGQPAFWESVAAKENAIWQEAAQDAWMLTVRATGPDFCMHVRAVLRLPWQES